MKEPEADVLAQILTTVPDFILVMDLEGRIRYINRVEEGRERSDFVGRPAHEMTPEGTIDAFESALASLRETGKRQEYEVRVVLPDGWSAWLQVQMVPFGPLESLEHVLLLARDITERKEAQEEAARLKKLLPLCSWCERIRTSPDEWKELADYLAEEEGTAVSHGICPDCLEQLDRSADPPTPSSEGAA